MSDEIIEEFTDLEPRMSLKLECHPLLGKCGKKKTWKGNKLAEIIERVEADGWDYKLASCPEHTPRVDAVEGEFFRKGKCDACGKSGVERTKTFRGKDMDEVYAKAAAWENEPLRHKKCEP
jgi:hypothetical protein